MSPKHIICTLSGLATAGGGSAATWWLIKEKRKEELYREILNKCGEGLANDWYEDGEKQTIPMLFDNEGNKLPWKGEKDTQWTRVDQTKGYYKKNQRDNNADEYKFCKGKITNINPFNYDD